jgi:hypothetical protein
MKKFNKIVKDNQSSKKHANHTDPSRNSSMKQSLKEAWSKLMHSTHNKLSEGSSEYTREIRSRGGSNRRVDRGPTKGHHKVYHNKSSKKK